MNLDLTTFDIAKYLNNKEIIAEYLSQVLSEGDSNELFVAIGNIAKAIGMTKISKNTGLSRTSLYKSFTFNSKPQFETIKKVINSFDLNIQITTKEKNVKSYRN